MPTYTSTLYNNKFPIPPFYHPKEINKKPDDSPDFHISSNYSTDKKRGRERKGRRGEKEKKRREKKRGRGEKEKKRGGSPHPCKEPPLSRRRRPTLPHCGAVPSARPGLTSLFGMGRGGTPGPKPPEYDVSDIDRKQKRERPEEKTRTPALADMRKTHGADTSVCAFTGKAGGLLVLLGCGRRRPCTCSLSTSSSLTAL